MSRPPHGEILRWYGSTKAQRNTLALLGGLGTLLVLGLRDVLGIGRDGILVRRALPGQRARWVPWTDIERFDAAWTKGYRSKVLQLFVVLADGEKLPVTGCTRSDTAKMHTLLSALGNERVRFSPRRDAPWTERPENRTGDFQEIRES